MTTASSSVLPSAGRGLRAAPHGVAARIMLAFLATAGLFYVNIMPALVDGLVEGLGFSNPQAGNVSSANIYGAALGALLVVLVVGRWPWRRTSVGLLFTLLALDTISIFVVEPSALTALRFIHGVVGGALVGVAFAVIARTDQPDRTFGFLLLVQFGLGGLGVMFLPKLVPLFGTPVLFLSLIAFSMATLAMVPFLDDYRVDPVKHIVAPGANLRTPMLLALLAIFLFQAANMGLYAFIIGMGKHYGLTVDFISPVLGIAAWTGILGSVLVIWLSTKHGRLLPLSLGILTTAVGTWILHYSGVPWLFVVANVGVGVTWAFVISYLLGLCAAFDRTGRAAALGGFASKMGLASGPLLASRLLGEDNYPLVINVSVIALLLCLVAAALPAGRLDRPDCRP